MGKSERPKARAKPDVARGMAARKVTAAALYAAAREQLTGRPLTEDDVEALSLHLGYLLTRENFVMHTQMRGRPRTLEQYENLAFGDHGARPPVHYYIQAHSVHRDDPDALFAATPEWDDGEQR